LRERISVLIGQMQVTSALQEVEMQFHRFSRKCGMCLAEPVLSRYSVTEDMAYTISVI
jgi:hypothetical protein